MSPGATMERVYHELKARIMRGDYAPGLRLDPVQLARTLSASATPVRDALHRLSGERLVDSWHQEGFRQPLMSEAELGDLYAWSASLLMLALAGQEDAPLVAEPRYGGTDPRDYGREELCAELASAFLCAALGIAPTVRHADYLGAWLAIMRADTRAIFKAASLASKAADYLLAFAPAAVGEASKRKGGRVYIEVHATGEVEFHEGYITDREAAARARGEKAETQPKVQRPEVTSAMNTYIDLHRHAAVRAELARHGSVALRALAAHELFVADYGEQRTLLMRTLFRQVQMIDGFELTEPNARGCVPEILREAGFREVEEVKIIQTPTGSISLYRGRR